MPETRPSPANLIGSNEIPLAGDAIRSTNPARPDDVLWTATPTPDHIDPAVSAARAALPEWSAWEPARRFEVLRRFQALCREHADQIASLICDETGKAMWEAKAEAGLLASKVDITLEQGEHSGQHRVSGFAFPMTETKTARCWFRPHGVMGVVGPFNFPAHLPNGHIIPALAAGNTIVFKPSDKTPAVGQRLAELYRQALADHGAPPGVVNLLHGAADVAAPLVTHPDLDGILFTGSWPVGRRILEANLDNPGRLVALEMGGNNPAIVLPDADLRQATIECVRAAFVTTGQRCTCTRRLILHREIADQILPAILTAAAGLAIDDPRSDQPVFMGPIISERARDDMLAFQTRLADRGGKVLLKGHAPESPAQGWYVTPSVVQVERFDRDTDDAGCDEEAFAPLLRVSIVDSLDDAITQANATRYGLAASIFTKDDDAIARFMHETRAGCINVNTGTAGASSKLPFGGLGHSGNHRPAGAFSPDYCAFPIAGMIESGTGATMAPGMPQL